MNKLNKCLVAGLAAWYLLYPPMNKAGVPEPQKPYSYWFQMKAYDSASACEDGSNRWYLYLITMRGHIVAGVKIDDYIINTSLQGICVDSNDPRLTVY